MKQSQKNELYQSLAEFGGFTVKCHHDGRIEKMTSGFSVSTFKNYETITPIHNPELIKSLFDFYEAASAEVKGVVFGGWVDDGKVYLDLSTIVQDKEEALELAKLNEQIAIFDLDKGEEIRL